MTHAVAPEQLGASATLAEIEACVSRNLPDAAGVIEFSVEAVDRSGTTTASRAEIRWTKDEDELARIILRVSETGENGGNRSADFGQRIGSARILSTPPGDRSGQARSQQALAWTRAGDGFQL